MTTVLDTHAWLWWVTGDRRLSKAARVAIERAQRDHDLWLSMISVWELAKKAEKGQLVFDRPLREVIEQALAQPGLEVAEITRPILLESCTLPGPFHGDPADQIIVATTRLRSAKLVTADQRIRDYDHVRTVW